jgi:hypothetical protein
VLEVLLVLVPLQQEPVRPSAGQGYAATILAAFAVMGLLALLAVFVSSKPRNRRRRR